MSLFDDAAIELREIINDDLGATVVCTITSPDDVFYSFNCCMSDISQTLDVNTRERISGRRIEISVSMLDLAEVGFESIRGVEKKTEKPWRVEFNNVISKEGTYKIVETAPDSSLGIVVIHMEIMR